MAATSWVVEGRILDRPIPCGIDESPPPPTSDECFKTGWKDTGVASIDVVRSRDEAAQDIERLFVTEPPEVGLTLVFVWPQYDELTTACGELPPFAHFLIGSDQGYHELSYEDARDLAFATSPFGGPQMATRAHYLDDSSDDCDGPGRD